MIETSCTAIIPKQWKDWKKIFAWLQELDEREAYPVVERTVLVAIAE